MVTGLLQTKLYIPPIRPKLVSRQRLIEQLNAGFGQSTSISESRFSRKLTLVSAPAGFGKTTLISEWAASCKQRKSQVRVAWLSLDKDDNDVNRFLAYVVAALQTIAARQETVGNIGEGVLNIL